MLGFKIDENMVGTHTLLGIEDLNGMLSLQYSLTWGNTDLFKFFNPFSEEFLSGEAKGVFTARGLVNKADCSGSIRLLYFTERKIRYRLFFQDEKGKHYRYDGEKKNIWPWNLYITHFRCYGTITDLETNQIISESVVYFPYRQIMTFILSFRLGLGSIYRYS